MTISGAGTVFVGGASNITLGFVRLEGNRNFGLGAGALAVSEQSQATVSHSIFTSNLIENEMGLMGPDIPRASCITADASAVSVAHSEFESNTGDAILAPASATIDLANSVFKSNRPEVAADNSLRRQLFSDVPTNNAADELPPSDQPAFQRRRLASSVQVGAVIVLAGGAMARISSTSFSSNVGLTAGAITVSGDGTAVFLDRADFNTNTATASENAGGALHVSGGAVARGMNTVFDANSAASQLAGGAGFASSGGDVVLTDSVLSTNTAYPHPEDGATYGGGALYMQQAHVRLIRTAVQDNAAIGGTAITASNFVNALYILAPLAIFVEEA